MAIHLSQRAVFRVEHRRTPLVAHELKVRIESGKAAKVRLRHQRFEIGLLYPRCRFLESVEHHANMLTGERL